jgi:hypothetical protein
MIVAVLLPKKSAAAKLLPPFTVNALVADCVKLVKVPF